jgi:hypothetical protein
MVIAFPVTIVVIVIIFWLWVYFSATSRLKRKRRRMLRRNRNLIDAKVRLGKGKRFDCPACGSTVPCSNCLRA